MRNRNGTHAIPKLLLDWSVILMSPEKDEQILPLSLSSRDSIIYLWEDVKHCL